MLESSELALDGAAAAVQISEALCLPRDERVAAVGVDPDRLRAIPGRAAPLESDETVALMTELLTAPKRDIVGGTQADPPVGSTLRAVPIPLSADQWVTLQGAFPLPEADWDQLMRVLAVMKPGLVSRRLTDTALTVSDSLDATKS